MANDVQCERHENKFILMQPHLRWRPVRQFAGDRQVQNVPAQRIYSSDLKTTQRYADLDANDLRAAINLLGNEGNNEKSRIELPDGNGVETTNPDVSVQHQHKK